jgi:integrase
MRGYTQRHGKSWRYRIEFDPDNAGKRKTISKSGFKKESDAKKALREKLVEIDKGNYVEDKKITLESYLNEWIESYKVNVAPSTYKRYKELMATAIRYIGKVELLKLTPLNIQTFYSKLLTEGKLSNATIVKIHRTLSLALKQAVGWNMINNNPCANIKPPKIIKKEMTVWSEDELKSFLYQSRNEHLYLHIALAAGTGMRLGEICALKWDCVDLKKGEIIVKRSIRRIGKELIVKEPKTKSSIRKISIANDLKDILVFHQKKQEHLIKDNEKYNDRNYVCAWEDDGRPYDPDYVTKNFHLLLANYELPMIRFHDLRHTHATILLLHDVPAKIVSERLGHSNIGITLDTYSHVLPSMQKAAAEKLNGLFSSAQ